MVYVLWLMPMLIGIQVHQFKQGSFHGAISSSKSCKIISTEIFLALHMQLKICTLTYVKCVKICYYISKCPHTESKVGWLSIQKSGSINPSAAIWFKLSVLGFLPNTPVTPAHQQVGEVYMQVSERVHECAQGWEVIFAARSFMAVVAQSQVTEYTYGTVEQLGK